MKIKDFIEQPKYFKEPKEDELCPLQKLIIWLKEQNTFYIDNQGIYYNTIQINKVIRKIEELIKWYIF